MAVQTTVCTQLWVPFAGRKEMLVYFHGILGVLTSTNVILIVLTVKNLVRSARDARTAGKRRMGFQRWAKSYTPAILHCYDNDVR